MILFGCNSYANLTNLSLLSLSSSDLSQFTVCCIQTLHGALLRLPIKVTGSSSVSSSLIASVSERHMGPVWYLAVWPLRLLCSGTRPFVVILSCCAAHLKHFLLAWCLSFLSNPVSTEEVGFQRQASQAINCALCHYYCLNAICNSHRMYVVRILQPFASFMCLVLKFELAN